MNVEYTVQDCPDCSLFVACVVVNSVTHMHAHDCRPTPADQSAAEASGSDLEAEVGRDE